MNWKVLTKTIPDPKLRLIENEMFMRGIRTRRNGFTINDTPILEIHHEDFAKAEKVLDEFADLPEEMPGMNTGRILLFHNTGFVPNPEMILRHVKFQDSTGSIYELMTYDTGKQDRDGRTLIGFKFWRGSILTFSGTSFSVPVTKSIDSDETLRSLLTFLSLRPGDTDKEYFNKYTPDQMYFANNYAEYLQADIDYIEFTDVEV